MTAEARGLMEAHQVTSGNDYPGWACVVAHSEAIIYVEVVAVGHPRA
jgi:hypothetical protein